MSASENLGAMLQKLMDIPRETEWVEFKEAKYNFDFDDLGKYFSALSNAANLAGQPAGWLVFGVTDSLPRRVVGSNYRLQQPGLERLKNAIAKSTNHQTTFRAIHELYPEGKRVVLFEIPQAARGIPTTWKGIAYGRIHESLGPLTLQKIDQIRGQATIEDWSAQVCEGATMNDLDPAAIAFGRDQYKKKNPNLAVEMDGWDDLTFLRKAKLCISDRPTRAAIILLGRSESAPLLSPAAVRISWLLRDDKAQEKDYQHFGTPFILAVQNVFARIRNITYRYLPDASLFPTEITQYDSWVIREVLHNCIAHQDYTRGGHINIVEEPDSLLFTNLGDFLPGTVEEVIRRDAPPDLYRNRFLAEAMVNLNMIDTIGSGIKRMFTKQRDRYFPLPDYDLSQPGRVEVRIIGKVIDERYTRVLMQKTDLHLEDVIALDKVQKGRPITDEEFRSLKKKRLVEGRRPNLFVSAKVAAATDTRADYIRKRAFDKQHYMKMIKDYLEKFTVASRSDFDKLLIDKLSDALNAEQKRIYISNLLQEMRRNKIIRPKGGKRGRGAQWELYKSSSDG